MVINEQDLRVPTPSIEKQMNAATAMDDLNDYCLQEVFARLDIFALANVAKCCKRFQRLAHSSFRQDFKSSMNYEVMTCKNCPKKINESRIIFKEFGSELVELSFAKMNYCCIYGTPRKISIHFVQQFSKIIDANILQTLDFGKIKMRARHMNLMMSEIKMLPQLLRLTIKLEGNNYYQIGDLSKWCPNLNYLSVKGDINLNNTLTNCFASLKELVVRANYAISKRNMTIYLNNNSQINKLTAESLGCYKHPNELIDHLVQFPIYKTLEELNMGNSISSHPFQNYNFTENLMKLTALTSLRLAYGKNIISKWNGRIISQLTGLNVLCFVFEEDMLQLPMTKEFLRYIVKLRDLKHFSLENFTILDSNWQRFMELKPIDCQADIEFSHLTKERIFNIDIKNF